MDKDKKILIQQNIIEDQNRKIEELKKKINSLEEENTNIKLVPREGYEKAKKLIIDLNEKIAEYNNIIKEALELKVEYNKSIQEINKLKIEYSKKMDTLFSDIKKGSKKYLK